MGRGKLEPFLDNDYEGSAESKKLINRKNLFCGVVSISLVLIATMIVLFFKGVISFSKELPGSLDLYHLTGVFVVFLITIVLSAYLIFMSVKAYLFYTDSLPIPESEMTAFHVAIENGMAYTELKPVIQEFIRTIDEIRGFPVNGDMRRLEAFYKTFTPKKPPHEKTESEKVWDRVKEETLKE